MADSSTSTTTDTKPKSGPAKGTPKTDVLQAMFRAFRKSWPILIACAVLGGGIGLLYGKSQPKVYEAIALVEFDPDVIRPLGMKQDPYMGWSAFWDAQQYYETQFRLIVSDRVLSIVVRDLGLQSDPKFWGFKPAQPMPLEDTTAALRGHIIVEPLKPSRLVNIHYEDTDPAQARRLANAVATTYIAQNLEKTVSATSDTLVWLSGQLDHFKNELETTENQLHEFKKKNDLPSSSLEEVSKITRSEMTDYDQALTHTRMRRTELAARNAELSKISADNLEEIPVSELLNNGFLSGLRTNYQAAVRERNELLAEGKGENHPSVKKVDEKIAGSRKAFFEEIKNIQGAVQRDLAIMERQEAGEAALYEASRRKAVDLNLKELEYHRLDRQRMQNEKIYGVLLDQTKDADLRRMMNTNNIRMVDPAVEPKGPIRPRISATAGAGLFIGLIVGLALMFVREQLDRSLKTPDDVEHRLGITFLGLLPEVESVNEHPAYGRKRRPRRPVTADFPAELIVHERPLSGIAEAARTIRTNLMFMNPDKPHRRLLITSAAPAEGKTTVACSIAISLAQSGQRVCILDCDLRKPRLHRIFDRVGDDGLTNVLVGDATIDDVVQPTRIENLYCVPSGPIPPNPADIVHSERFHKFMEDLGQRFDRIIIDSPPLVSVTDSAIIAKLVDGVVFVIRAFKTSHTLSLSGLRALWGVDVPVLGGVLNAVNVRRHEYQYYSYYYYRREGYGPSAEGDESSAAQPPPPAAPPAH